MSEQDLYLFFAVFDGESSAGTVAKAIHAAAKADKVHIDGLAAVHRDTHGHVHLHEIGDITGSQGAVRGGLAGAVIGLLFPPAILASAALGAAVAAAGAKIHDKGFKTRDLHALGEELDKGQSAVAFVGDATVKDALSDDLQGAESVSQEPFTPELKDQAAEYEGVV